MNDDSIFTPEFLRKAPVGFKMLKKKDRQDSVAVKSTSIDFFQTDSAALKPFYKPLSSATFNRTKASAKRE